METLLKTGEITLLDRGDTNNPIYILSGKGSFYTTEYKIMGTIPDLLKCYRASVNGLTELVYLTYDLVPLSLALVQMDENTFLDIAYKLCRVIKAVCDNGFLNWQRLDLAKERIFLNPSNKSLHLVYLPVEGVYLSPVRMEKEIMSLIDSWTKDTKEPDSIKLATLHNHMLTEDNSLNEFIGYLEKIKNNTYTLSERESNRRLTLRDDKNDYIIVVDKPRYLIGKKVTAVDGVIPYSKFVGRVHCQIVNKNGEYYIFDLDSKNGTFINGVSVEPDNGVILNNGDKVKIADTKFVVQFEEA